MGIKKFVNDVTDVLGLKKFDEQKKKKAIRKLLKKLEKKKEDVEGQLANHPKNKQSKELADELELIHYQIKKGKKLLAKLEKDNKK